MPTEILWKKYFASIARNIPLKIGFSEFYLLLLKPILFYWCNSLGTPNLPEILSGDTCTCSHQLLLLWIVFVSSLLSLFLFLILFQTKWHSLDRFCSWGIVFPSISNSSNISYTGVNKRGDCNFVPAHLISFVPVIAIANWTSIPCSNPGGGTQLDFYSRLADEEASKLVKLEN